MDNNILIISEKEQRAYLPYRYEDVLKIYKNPGNKYSSIIEVIQSLYVVPLKKFEKFSIARFREAFNLVFKKENGSFFKAFDLAIELTFKHNLNPIIIAACRNLDELDIYLDCLEENELPDFKCFEIRFDTNLNEKKIKGFYG